MLKFEEEHPTSPSTAIPLGERCRRRPPTVACLLSALVALVAVWLALASSALAAPTTTVSLTFDDGNADQMQALPIMQQYGVNGTFYIISGVVGAPNYFTLSNLQTIAGQGNEIAGHTVNHPDLTTVTPSEAVRQICNGRVTLMNWGFTVTDFAYPYAALNPAIETDVKNCGFNSARGLGDIKSAHSDPGVTQLAETTPPADPYDLAAVDELDTTWTLAQMESVVTKAEKGGGWIIFTIHHLCSGAGCDSLSITPATFTSFLAWLKTQKVSVKTVASVIGGPVQPAVMGPPAPTTTALQNPSLETAGTAPPFPACWQPAGWGTNTVSWADTSAAHTGSQAMTLNLTGYASGDAKLIPTMDLGGCSPSVTQGLTYNVGTWYQSTGTTQFALYYRDSNGAWYYWTSSPWFAPSTSWAQATFTTPPAPAGATGMSFGLALITNGSLTTDDYSMAPASGMAAENTALSMVGPLRTAARVTKLSPPTPLPRGRPRHVRPWGRHDSPSLPDGLTVRPGTRVIPPYLSDGSVTGG